MDDSYSSVSGTFDTNEDAAKEDSDEESDSSSSSSAYPDEVMKVLRTLKDGEIGPDVIETDTSYYVVKLDKVNDEEATETKKQSIISTRENKLYTDTTEKWLDDADINVEKKVLKTLKVTDCLLYTSGIQIREMNSGCICCSLVGDFGASLKEVISKYHPDRILIEPSGVGKLSDVIKAVQGVEEETGLVLNSYTCLLYTSSRYGNV